MMNEIIQHLNDSRNPLLVSHSYPDGDAIGSLLALGLAMESSNKKVEVSMFNSSPIPAVYRFLPHSNRIKMRINRLKQFDLGIVLDCGNLERVGNIASIMNNIPIINIDHHVTNTGFGNLKLINSKACATTEILFKIITKMNVEIDKSIATSIYTGILTDTGSFRFSNTNRSAFEICGKMIAAGVDPYKIAQRVYGTYSLGRIKLLNMALDSIELSKNGKVSIMTLTRKMIDMTKTQPEDADGLINYAKGIKNVDVAICIQELNNFKHRVNGENKYHVSLRSNGKTDVAAIASVFGGGGHFNAAGFSVDAPLDEIKSKVFKLTKKYESA